MPTTYTPSNTNHNTITLPSDGDAASAASVDTPLEAIADNALFLFNRLYGAYRVVAVSATINPGPAGWGSLGAYDVTIGASPGPLLIATGSGFAGDIVEVSGSVSMVIASGGSTSYLRVEYKEHPTNSGSTTGDANSEQVFAGTTLGTFPGVSFTSTYQLLTDGDFAVFFNGHETGAGAPNGSLAITGGSFVYKVYRQNL